MEWRKPFLICYILLLADCKSSKKTTLPQIQYALSFQERGRDRNKRSAVYRAGKITTLRKFRENRKNGHFLQSLILKMVGMLQLKLPILSSHNFFVSYFIIKILQYIFLAGGESRFSTSEIKRSDFPECFPDFCFSNRKACDLCSPENLSGDHRKHRGKCENSRFSPAL